LNHLNKMTTEEKFTTLKERLKQMDRVIIAFSGGVDSTFLVKTASIAGLSKVMAVTGVSASLSREEGSVAKKLAETIDVEYRTITTGDFVDFLVNKQLKGKSRHVQSYVDELYDRFIRETVIAYEESILSDKYPDFRYIYEEYHDGILLFDIMDQQVWSRAISDSSGLEAYYRANRKQYMWGERTDAYIVSCSEGVDVTGVRSAHKKIRKGKLDQEALNEMYCSNDTVPCIRISHLVVEKGENELIDASWGISGPGPVQTDNGTSSFVIVRSLRSPEPKKLEETRGQVTSDYQEYLESEWLESLRAKYPVSVNEELLKQINP